MSSPEGAELPAVPQSPKAEGDGLVETHRQMGLDITADTLCYGGERFDLGLTIDAILGSSQPTFEGKVLVVRSTGGEALEDR